MNIVVTIFGVVSLWLSTVGISVPTILMAVGFGLCSVVIALYLQLKADHGDDLDRLSVARTISEFRGAGTEHEERAIEQAKADWRKKFKRNFKFDVAYCGAGASILVIGAAIGLQEGQITWGRIGTVIFYAWLAVLTYLFLYRTEQEIKKLRAKIDWHDQALTQVKNSMESIARQLLDRIENHEQK